MHAHLSLYPHKDNEERDTNDSRVAADQQGLVWTPLLICVSTWGNFTEAPVMVTWTLLIQGHKSTPDTRIHCASTACASYGGAHLLQYKNIGLDCGCL